MGRGYKSWVVGVGVGMGVCVSNMQKEVDRPTRLLQFVAFVDLPFSFRSLDLFVASLLFRKGTSFCAIRRK